MGDDRAERMPPGGGGQRAERAGGGGGRYEEAGPACKCRACKESPIFIVPRETINHLQFFEGVRINYKVVDIFRLVLYAFE